MQWQAFCNNYCIFNEVIKTLIEDLISSYISSIPLYFFICFKYSWPHLFIYIYKIGVFLWWWQQANDTSKWSCQEILCCKFSAARFSESRRMWVCVYGRGVPIFTPKKALWYQLKYLHTRVLSDCCLCRRSERNVKEGLRKSSNYGWWMQQVCLQQWRLGLPFPPKIANFSTFSSVLLIFLCLCLQLFPEKKSQPREISQC